MNTEGMSPMSLLNSMLARKKLQPWYNLLAASGVGTHVTIFHYEVTAGDLVKGQGKGSSKKEAQQDAAKAALENLKSANISGTPDTSVDEELLQIPNVDAASWCQAKVTENFVGKLKELCENSQLPAPVYQVIHEYGPSHAKLFELECQVSSFKHSAVARTKQQAKHLAAKLMIETLQKLQILDQEELPAFPLSTEQTAEERTRLMESIDEARNSRGLNTLPTQRLLGRQLGGPLKHDWPEEKLAEIREMRKSDTNALAQLEQICTHLDLKMSHRDIDCNRADKKLSMLSLATQPESCFLGSGETRAAAKTASAARALSFLDAMVIM